MKIVILGGGISGLSAAYFARQKYPDAEICLLEKTGHLGGWMQIQNEEGFLFERGPRTFAFDRCPHLLGLIDEIGLADQLIYSDPSANRRYLWHQEKLRTLSSFLPMLFFSLLREPFIPRGTKEDESIYDFSCRRLGPKVTETLIDAMALGIYAGDIHCLSIRSCFPFLVKWEKEKGSLVLGALSSLLKKKKKRGLFTLRKGMETLIQALAVKAKTEIHLDTAVEEILPNGVIANGKRYGADLTFSALNGAAIGRLSGLWTDFAEGDLGIVHLAYRGRILPKKGFGYLVPTIEKENLLGMVWDSSVFPEQSSISQETRVTAMMKKPNIEEALDCMKRHLGVSELPIFTKGILAKGALPQFHIGYAARLARFEEEMKKKYSTLRLLGNYRRGASVDACIALAKEEMIEPHRYTQMN